ncbi:hypothetical protein [Thermogemmatispora carboxidivorans]|uniref:hypothetical protein n=1 Tax=Thermogemmatispora carboxidivorans TaxID=1382306 RepID=UPI0012DF6143|nr:hypothetical protein [Thermogemmatispora carboxidivorans]
MRTVPGREVQASATAGYALGQSGLWSGADPALRNLLIVLTVAWYVILLLPVNQVFFLLGRPLAEALMERFDLGDIGAFVTAYIFWACLCQSMFAIMGYFACGWPPIARDGQPSHPHGLGPALRATYWYLLADAVLFFPYFVLLLFIYSGFQLQAVIAFFSGPLLSGLLFLLLEGLFFNSLLALTLGLGAYWLAARLGSQASSGRGRERRNKASRSTPLSGRRGQRPHSRQRPEDLRP